MRRRSRYTHPLVVDSRIGFRVARNIPEPSSLLLGALAGLGLLVLRRTSGSWIQLLCHLACGCQIRKNTNLDPCDYGSDHRIGTSPTQSQGRSTVSL